jgi:hypothetical protein
MNGWKTPAYLPSPEEIERQCEMIQRRWSESERQRRLLFVLTDCSWYSTDSREQKALECAGS